MANVIRVTPEELESTAGKLESWTDQYASCVNGIIAVGNDLPTNWGGEAQQSYLTQLSGFQDDFERLYTLFNKYGTYLRQTAAKYREAESNIRDSAKGLSTGL